MEESLRYNIFYNAGGNCCNILDINYQELGKFLDCYKHGVPTVLMQGKKYWFSNIREIQIFTYEPTVKRNGKELYEHCKHYELLKGGGFGQEKIIPPEILEQVGHRVTDEYILDDFGYLKELPTEVKPTELFVDINRIQEIESINNKNLDFTKLVAFLKELNIVYVNELYLTVPLLVRAIIDHIPPIFNKPNFSDVCGSCGSKSFKESMAHLDKSSRKIADAVLHNQIRNKEVLPNKTQINFKQDLDVLLQEIVRISKE